MSGEAWIIEREMVEHIRAAKVRALFEAGATDEIMALLEESAAEKRKAVEAGIIEVCSPCYGGGLAYFVEASGPGLFDALADAEPARPRAIACPECDGRGVRAIR